jgi:hypothetical protein
MPVVSTSAYDQAEDALNLARSLANDAAGAVFSDTVLMPFLNSAYRALQRPLAEAGVSVLIAQVCLDLPLTNGVTPTSLSDVSSPQLPTDLLCTSSTVGTGHWLKRPLHADGKNHRRAPKFSARLLPTHVGVAHGHNSVDRRDAGDHCAPCATKNLCRPSCRERIRSRFAPRSIRSRMQ